MNKMDYTNTIEHLKKAKALIASPDKWCQGAYAETADGNTVQTNSPLAEKFCSLGAIDRVDNSNRYFAQRAIEYYIATITNSEYGKTSVGTYNDTTGRTHEEILALFDGTIAMLEKEANETV